MATTKKKTAAESNPSASTRPAPEKPRNVAAYEAAVTEFAAASALFGRREFAQARQKFEAVTAMASADEPILADRARTYASICLQRMGGATAPVEGAESDYHQGVFAANAGRLEDALAFLDRAAQARPDDGSVLYARAAVRGLQGNADAAASELKKAVALDAKFRFQAASDPDFDRVRDEAAFIDVIEPTTAPRA